MKKHILYLLALVAMAFASCNPMEDTINQIVPDNGYVKTMTVTLTNSYATAAAANTGIPNVLNTNYPQLSNGSKANVTYNFLPAQIKPADSLLASVVTAPATVPTLYTVVDADYLAINGNANKNFATAKVIQFLDTKFPVKVENQLIVLNYVYYESGATTTAGVPVTDTFLYLNGAWVKAYQVTQAQYVSAGKLTVYNFGSADEANLAGYFNAFLKADPNVSAKAKIGDVKYMSFAYFASSKTYQRIKTLVFDGTNWGTKAVPMGPVGFLKKNGTWILDPTVYYTLVKADFAVLAGTSVASPAAVTNAVSFTSFDKTGGANNWTDPQIDAAVIMILNSKFASAVVDPTILYNITYTLYRGATPTVTKSFAKTSTGFVYVPPAP